MAAGAGELVEVYWGAKEVEVGSVYFFVCAPRKQDIENVSTLGVYMREK